jgi:RimJ/RimL family protein N-acetyltransferase
MFLPIETERLTIRPFVAADLDALHEVYGDAEVMRWAGGASDRDGTERALRTHIERHAEDGFAFWAVVERATGALIGDAGLGRLGDEVEIGWTLRRDRWGLGYATEAARPILTAALGPIALDHVIATIHPENAASARVADKIGLRPDGRMERDGVEQLRYVAP